MLKELAEAEKSGTQKQKSLRGGPVEVLVPSKVKWPHEYVLSGSHKERVSYDQLSIIQWVTGFCQIMHDEQDKTIQNSMLDYLIALFDDANDFSWDAAKASHAVLLCRMEQGEIKNYAQVEKIDRVRRANAQRHISAVSATSQMTGSKKYTSKSTKSMPCQYYNQGSCVHQKSHDTRGTLYKHICTHCFATSGKTFAHPESQCRTKLKKTDKKRITTGMSFDAHTRRFGTRFFHNSNAPFHSHFAELNTTKQTAFHWYCMQRACREYTPRLLYADVVKKHSNYTSKELLQSIPQTRSIAKVKHAFDPKTSHSSVLANKQLGRNHRCVWRMNKNTPIKHSVTHVIPPTAIFPQAIDLRYYRI